MASSIKSVPADDAGFMKKIQSMSDLDEASIEALLDKLDISSLIAFQDAVAKNDKAAVDGIIRSFESKDSFGDKKPVKPPENYDFSFGDDVAIKIKDKNGNDKFISATVSKPKAPGGTIGIKIDGKDKMVGKDDLYLLKERVIGMINMPDLVRMQQLAGIQQPQVSTEPVEGPAEQPTLYDCEEEMEEEMGDVAAALAALDALEEVLPNIRLADIKTIRQRMYELTAKINESISPGRSRKV